jgi:hypothetical protein
LLEECELLVFFFGQVRDTYEAGDYLVLVTTDRQSAFDRVLASVPFKGQVCFVLVLNKLLCIGGPRFVVWELAGSLVCFFPG